jgi:uncharacterized repeat protein (TIGR01451 family)
MLKQGKIRQRAFSLKFFSIQTKLILSLVFVFIIAIAFGYNYFQPAKADTLLYSETFLTTVKKDAVATTARWDTVAGNAKLHGRDWTDMTGDISGFENISVLTDNALNTDMIVGTNNIPYVIWEKGTLGSEDIYFSKYTPGVGWTTMDGTIGSENISNTPAFQSIFPHIALDSANNPAIIWTESSGAPRIRFRHWNPITVSWTDMAGTADYDILAGSPNYSDLKIANNNTVYVISDNVGSPIISTWSDTDWIDLPSIGVGGLYPLLETDSVGNPYVVSYSSSIWNFSRWNGSAWVTMAGDLGYEDISRTGNAVGIGRTILKLDNLDNPYFVWTDISDGDSDIYFTHWNGSAWKSMSGAADYEDVSKTSPGESNTPSMVLDAANNPYIIWEEGGFLAREIYFKRWSVSANDWNDLSGVGTFNNLSNNAGDSTTPFLAINSSGEAFAVWNDFTTGAGDIYFVRGAPGSDWKDLANNPGITNLSADAGESVFKHSLYRGRSFLLGADNGLYTSWNTNVGANYVISFAKIISDFQSPESIQSINVNSGTDLISSVKFDWTQTVPGGTSIEYFASSDGGANWIPITSEGTNFNFDTPGNDLRWRADLIGTASDTPVIDNLDITYQTKKIYCSIDSLTLVEGNQQVIRASLGYTPTSVWATIEKNDVLLSTVPMAFDIGSGTWIGNYPTSSVNMGQNDVAVFAGDLGGTYVCNPSTGADWQKMSVNDMAWPARTAFGAVSFKDKIFIMGGLGDRVTNDIWYSDNNGVTWVGPAYAPWPGKGAVNGRTNFGLIEFKDQLWFYGGGYYEDYTYDVPPVIYYNDSWYSDDGLTWQQVAGKENAPWATRQLFSLAVLDNNLYLSGGIGYITPNAVTYDDVWVTSNGVDWTCLVGNVDPACPNTTPGWAPRGGHKMVTWDDGTGKKLWILGGRDTSPVTNYFKDIYSSSDEGTTWDLVTATPEWGNPNPGENGRYVHKAVIFNEPDDDPDLGEKMYLMGGATVASDEIDYNDVWVTTNQVGQRGEHWTKIAPTADFKHYDYNTVPSDWPHWSARRGFETVVKDNEIYLLGGYEYRVKAWNDVWHTSNGSNWTLIGQNYDANFGVRWNPSLISFDEDNTGIEPEKLWLYAGTSGQFGGFQNDIWSSEDGADWLLEANGPGVPWAPRQGQRVVNFNNELFLIGGCGSGTGECFGKCSGGSVTYCANGIRGIATYCDLGFVCNSASFEEVWSSTDGTTWVPKAPPNWVGRHGATVTVFNNGTNNGIWMTGGQVYGRCNGGTRPGSICRRTADVPAQCPGGACGKICFGGVNRGLFCASDANCPASVCGGTSSNYVLNDVWFSPDGNDWFSGFCNGGTAPASTPCKDDTPCLGGGTCLVNKATWPARNMHAAAVLNSGSGDKLYVMGGWTGAVSLNTVYSTTDGRNWTLDPAVVPWSTRYTHEALTYNDKIYIISGNHWVPGSVSFFPALWTNDVYSFDGTSWSTVTTDADWYGRDFFASTIFKDRMWFVGGDSNGGTNNDVWASSYNYTDLNFTVVVKGGNPYLPPPSAPSNLTCQAIDLIENNILVKAINWNFVDTANNEFGFSLYDGETLIKEVPTQDLTQIQEKENLLPNKAYTRNVRSYNGDGNSSATAPATCYTLANVPNKVKITNITADSITIALDATDGNPAQTLYAIRVISGTATNFVNPDGSFSTTESWHTYAEFGGANGVVVTGVTLVVAASDSVQMVLTTGQNYSFSAKAKNGDTPAMETLFSDINDSIPQIETGPNISASKGVAVNLAWNSGFGLFTTAWAGNNLIIDLNGTLNRTLGVLSWLLNIILLILLVIFGISLVKTIKHLEHKFKYPETFSLVWSILSKESHHTYNQHAPQTEEGIYHSSAYHQHKKLQNLSKNTFLGALAVVGLKLFILGALFSGLVSLNHSGLAATPPYDQSGTEVKVGDTLSYIVEVNNNGTAIAQDLVISDTLSGYLTYESGSSGINFDSNTNTLTYSISSLGINENASMTFKAKVIAGSEEKLIANTANVSGSNFTSIASNPTSNQVGAAIPINENINQPPVNENINQPPINENINQPIINENINQPPANENINQSPTNENTNQPPVEPTESGTTESQIPIIGPIIDSINEVFDFIGQLAPVKFINEVVFDNPKVEQSSQNVVTPLIITIAIVNTLPAVLVITTYLLPYLHLIFLEPLLFLFGKKRKKWGVVYNSLTKKPVDLALVRLYNKETNQLVQTKVTDREGRYIMIAKEPGKYYLSVTKPGFIIPSSYLRGETQDTKYIDLYHGEVIEVTEKDAVLTANIPLDPAEKKSLAFAEIISAYLLKNLRLIVSYVGLILSLIIVLIIPTAITIGALIIHVLLFLFFRRFLVPPKPKSWGIVYDAKTKEPLGSSVVRIFDMKFNKLLETQVTDSKGRYSFLVGQNQYQMLAEKPGYQNKEVKPVDLVKKEEIVNLDVGLNKI